MTLLRRVAASLPWIPWLPVAVVVGLLSWGIRDMPPYFADRHLFLRSGLLVAAFGLSFAFDDPAAATADPSPSPLRLRRSFRALIAFVPWALMVAALVWSGSLGGPEAVLLVSQEPNPSQLPVGRLILEASTLGMWGLGLAAFVAKRWYEEPGKIVSPILLALFAATWLVPEQWRPWALPTGPGWKTVLPWWWLALIVAAGLVIGRAGIRAGAGDQRPYGRP